MAVLLQRSCGVAGSFQCLRFEQRCTGDDAAQCREQLWQSVSSVEGVQVLAHVAGVQAAVCWQITRLEVTAIGCVAHELRASGPKDTLASNSKRACSRLSILQFANGPKISMGHVLGAKKGNFLIRGRGRPTVYGGRASLILSIPAN